MDDAINLLEELMERHGLFELGWTYSIEKPKSGRWYGICVYERRLIAISPKLLTLHVSAVKDTVLHEIAHALVGPGHGHDAIWKAKARELGAAPNPCQMITTLAVIELPYVP